MTDVYLVPSFKHNIFSIEHFLAASDSNSVSLSSAERVLHTRDCDIPLFGEHKLIWLPFSRPKSTPASGSPSAPVADAVPAPAAAAPAAVPAGEAAAAAVVLPAVQTTMTMKLFHERMGHINTKDCAALAAQQGVRLTETVDFVCDICATAKQRKSPMPDLAMRRDVAPGEVLHCDLKGPLDLAYNKASFVLVVVDEATRVISTQAMKTKAECASHLPWRPMLLHEVHVVPAIATRTRSGCTKGAACACTGHLSWHL
jgi:hypothetical protein